MTPTPPPSSGESAFWRMEAERHAPPSCPECDGRGYVEGPGCNCGGYGDPFFMHERYCGLEPCPRGCPFVPPGESGYPIQNGG